MKERVTTINHRIDRVLLNMPSLLPVTLSDEATATSWIQLAKTGSFVSNRYGQFEISKTDLSQMLTNFRDGVMPKAPTELPIDFDHLSMSPQRPGDGIAAGWLKKLELRSDGEELWGLVSWTARATDAIRNQEYKFVSPSFVKDFTDTTTGKKIGTTLLAAAITNHPFLQKMAGLVLSSHEVMGNLAVNATGLPPQENAVQTFHLAKIGDKVSFIDDPIKVPELTPKEMTDTYVVKAVVDGTDQQFVRLETLDGGKEFGWFAVDQLAPAPAPKKKETPPAPMEPVIPTTPEQAVAIQTSTPEFAPPPAQPSIWRGSVTTMSDTQATDELVMLSTQLAKERGLSLSAATKEASTQRPDLVLRRDGYAPPVASQATPISLSTTATATFFDLVMDLKQARKIGDLEAVQLAQTLYPEAAARYRDGDF